MRSIAVLTLAKNVENFRTDNDVGRPLLTTNKSDNTLDVAKQMLKMFSVNSYDNVNIHPELVDFLERAQFDSDSKLGQCKHSLPTDLNGGIIDSTCKEDALQLHCDFKCNSNDLDLLDVNFTYDGEISCSCVEKFAGIVFNVPCSWSSVPSCAASELEVNDHLAKCGPLLQENGEWICSDGLCHLQCHHGYLASDFENQMAAKCLCSKHGDCRWQKSSTCEQTNKQTNECDLPAHPVGKYQCSGNGHGDQCALECEHGFAKEQYGIRECICDGGGGCDWLGHRGTCTAEIGLSILDEFDSTSLLSSAKCDKLPEAQVGVWRCSESADKCRLICPSGLQPNQVVDIQCHCQQGHCLYGLSRFETRFGITSDFERKLDFRCLDNYELYEDSMLDKCLNLPHVANGEWLCSDNGTCSLACGGSKTEEIVIDCLNSNSLDLDLSAISCQMTNKSIMAKLEKQQKLQFSANIQERLNSQK
jgi:hypothetical protein